MKIYLIRHSESHDDLINCYGGASDWDFDRRWSKESWKFRPKLEKLKVQKIFVSPLKRVYKTAEILIWKGEKTNEKIEIF